MLEKTIAATVHGRYLMADARGGFAGNVLIGFHGYAEPAEAQFERLQSTPGSDRWRIAAVQGLNRFYDRRTNSVVAGWMTRQDRELAIADNLTYVASVVDQVCDGAPVQRLVFSGFSQGTAMTFRAAAASRLPVAGVIAVGGDVPPEIGPDRLGAMGRVLICHGSRDDWYTADKFRTDVDRLRTAGAAVVDFDFDGKHEWSAPVIERCAAFLRELAV